MVAALDGSGRWRNDEPTQPVQHLRQDALCVTILSARGLRNADWGFGDKDNKSDPYCVCEIPGKQGAKVRTHAIQNTLNPVWNTEVVMRDWQVGDSLKFTVYDKDIMKRSDCLGHATLLSSQFDMHGFDGELTLYEAGAGIHAFLSVRVTFGAPPEYEESPPMSPAFSQTEAAIRASPVASSRTLRARRGGDSGITRGQFRDFVRTERDRAMHCSTLPFTLVLWITYSVVAWSHGNASSSHRMRVGIYNAINKVRVSTTLPDGTPGVDITLGTISTTGEMWNWIADGLVPKLSGVPGRRGFLNAFNKVVGRVQLRQRRVVPDRCNAMGTKLQGYFSMRCRTGGTSSQNFGPTVGANETRDPAFVSGGALSGLPASVDGLFFAFLNIMPATEGVLRAQYLADQSWYDEATDWTEIHVMLFNGEVDAFTHMVARFDFQSGGLVAGSLDVEPLYVQEWPIALVVLDCFWLLLVLVLIILSSQEVADRKEHGACSRCCGNPWLVLDMLSSLAAAGLVAVFIVQWLATKALAAQLGDLGRLAADPTRNATLLARTNYEQNYDGKLTVITEALSRVVLIKQYHRIAMCWYTGFILLRFFRGFLGQPLIASIGRTVAAAIPDLFHLSLILAVLFENFVLGGCLLFGAELEEWSTVDHAHRSTLAIFCGLGDFGAMYGLYPVSATCWLFSFAVTVIFIASNMIVAIMVDHFMDVRTDLGQGEQTIWEQTWAGIGDMLWHAGFHARNLVRLLAEKVPKVGALLPEMEPESARVPRVPYTALLQALDPDSSDDLDDPAGPTSPLSTNRPAWAKSKPLWAPLDLEVLDLCGCDPATAQRLLAKCARTAGRHQPARFPAPVVYHEFQSHMEKTYELLENSREDLQLWLSSRREDCANLEPRQRKLEQLAMEKILPKPQDGAPMLMPGSPEEAAPRMYVVEESPDVQGRNMLKN